MDNHADSPLWRFDATVASCPQALLRPPYGLRSTTESPGRSRTSLELLYPSAYQGEGTLLFHSADLRSVLGNVAMFPKKSRPQGLATLSTG
jgi:hypothetical protein